MRRATAANRFEAWLGGLVFAWAPAMVARTTGHFSLAAAAALPAFLWCLINAERITFGERRGAGRPVHGVGGAVGRVLRRLLPDDRDALCRRDAAPRDARGTARAAAVGLAARRADRLLRRVDRRPGARTRRRVHAARRPGARAQPLQPGADPDRAGDRCASCIWWRPHFELPIARAVADQGRSSIAALACAGPLAPVLYGLGERIAEGRFVSPQIFWRSSPRGVDRAVVRHAESAAPDCALVQRRSARDAADALRRIHRVAEPRVADRDRASRSGAPVIGRASGWFVLTIGFALLALGPFIYIAGVNTHVPGPWALLRYAPGFGLARMPSRFSIVVVLGVAVLMAGALAAIGERWPQRRRLIGAVVALLLVFELWPAPRTLYSAEISPIYDRIAADPRPVRVLVAAVRRARRRVGNRQLPAALAVQPDAPRQGADRRLSVAHLAQARRFDARELPDARRADQVEREEAARIRRSSACSTSAATVSSSRRISDTS